MDIPGISDNISFAKLMMEKKSLPLINPDGQSDVKLKDACQQFEAIFVRQLLKEMRKTIGKDGILPESHERSIYQSMFDEEIANQVSKEGKMGLAEMLYDQMRPPVNSSQSENGKIKVDGKEFIKLNRDN